MKLALRTQQILAEETRVTDVVDPLGGSYYVEALTGQIEAEVHRVDPAVEARQVARVREVRRRRDGARVAALLYELARQARDPAQNLMPVTLELVSARATLGEIVARLRETWGRDAG